MMKVGETTKNMKVKYLLVIVATMTLVFSLAGAALAQERPLELNYPQIIPSVQAPQTTKTLLPDLVMYWITLAMVGSGVVIFFSLLQAGWRYLTSTGNPGELSDSKDQIVAAFLGAALLLGSYIVLQTVNPQITFLRIGEVRTDEGIQVNGRYTDGKPGSKLGDTLVKESLSCVGDTERDPDHPGQLRCKNNFETTSIDFVFPPGHEDDFDIYIYSEGGYKGSFKKLTPSDTSLGGIMPRSIVLAWKVAGVYLYPETNYGGRPVLYTTTTANLTDFVNKAKSIKFVNQLGSNFGAVLHQKKNFSGQCYPAYNDVPDLTGTLLGTNSGSITVFQQQPVASGGVRIYEGYDFRDRNNNDNSIGGLYQDTRSAPVGYVIPDDTASSVKIEGNYLAMLFADPNFRGECQVFNQSNSNLSTTRVGKCFSPVVGSCPVGCPYIPVLNWCPPEFCFHSCVSSLIVVPGR